MKMLIVDDHQLVRDGMRHVAEQLADAERGETVTVLEVSNHSEALECVRENPDLDLVLLDLCLPGVIGYAALVDLQDRHPDIPVAVISALDDPDIVRETLERGAMGFIPKSSSSRVILGALRLILSGGIYLPQQAINKKPPKLLPLTVATPPPVKITPKDLGLTDRQADVLKSILAGKSNKMICRELDLAPGTVKNHIGAILKALNVESRVQVVLVATKLGMAGAPKKTRNKH